MNRFFGLFHMHIDNKTCFKMEESITAGIGNYQYLRTVHGEWLYSENHKEVNEPGLSEALEEQYQKIKQNH